MVNFLTDNLWLIPFSAYLGFLLNFFFGKRLGTKFVSYTGCGAIFVSFFLSILCGIRLFTTGETSITNTLFTWISLGDFVVPVSFYIDGLSLVMVLVVTFDSLLIHIYSVGYMGGDRRYSVYFGYLNLFVGMMLVLVMGSSLVLMFLGWEGVGLCSYLLIGFWYEDIEKARAGMKAFVVNRVGDFGFLVGMLLLMWGVRGVGGVDITYEGLRGVVGVLDRGLVGVVGILLFIGAVGKSAQVPLYVWLPDAMAGPTPVSALIHAATMVTAGVYMVGRMGFMYDLVPWVGVVIVCVGLFTAVYAGSMGLVANDIKKVLAYSTVSQLGYMFCGVGVGWYWYGIYHLVTHAFFKALLFLGSGSVIHGMGGEQDIRRMGGLMREMPWTGVTFLVGGLAIGGFPYLSGYYSKDGILMGLEVEYGWGVCILGLIGAFLTALYMFRLIFLN